MAACPFLTSSPQNRAELINNPQHKRITIALKVLIAVSVIFVLVGASYSIWGGAKGFVNVNEIIVKCVNSACYAIKRFYTPMTIIKSICGIGLPIFFLSTIALIIVYKKYADKKEVAPRMENQAPNAAPEEGDAASGFGDEENDWEDE